MDDIVLAGSGGCMRELAWQIQEWNRQREGWNVLGYVDREPPCGRDGVWVGGQRIPYLGDDEFLLRQETQVNAVLCVGEPKLRKKIASRLQENPHIRFPNLILGNTRICEDVQMGMGCIVSMDARISTNVTLGDFVFLNLGSGICHDGRIGDFVTGCAAGRLRDGRGWRKLGPWNKDYTGNHCREEHRDGGGEHSCKGSRR